MMTRGFVSVLCAVGLVGLSVQSPTAECVLNTGIQQAQEGEYASSITTLRCVVDRLASSSNPQAKTDLKTAYVYLGVSYLGLDQEAEARKVLISALKLDSELQLKTTDFPPRVVRFFDKVHQEAIAAKVVSAPRGNKKSSKAPLFIIGGVAVAGGGAALALGGGSKPTPTPTPTQCAVHVTPDGAGISSATEFTFSCDGATGPGPLNFRWQFSDGGTAAGQTVKHVFGVAANATATAFVSNAGGEVQAQPVTVTIKSMSGVWHNQQGDTVRNWTITQNGPQITGTYFNSSCQGNTGALEGTVSSPRNVHIQATVACYGPIVFNGATDANINTMTGDAGGVTLTFTRQ